MTTKAKKTVKIIVDVLLWTFLVFSFFMTVLAYTAQSSNGGYPKLGKNCLLTVSSDSMAAGSDFYKDKDWEINKGFKRGDLIFSKKLTEEEKLNVKVGDVITFYADLGTFKDGKYESNPDGIKELNTHRIISVIKNPDPNFPNDIEFLTKGDNNDIQDNYTVKITDVEAIWNGSKVGGFGTIIGFLQSSTGFLVCIVIPLAIFFVYEIIILVTTANKVKNKGKRSITKEDEEVIKQRAIEEYLAKKAQEEAQAGFNAANATENQADSGEKAE